MNKIYFLVLGIILFFLIMPLAQASSVDLPLVSQKYPGVYIVDKSSIAHDSYDPATNYENFGNSIIQEVYEGLYGYNGSDVSTYRPVLATKYTVSPDGLNYTFTIRKGVTFTDGSPLNAYVFQYSIQRAILMNDHSSGIWILDQSIRNASAFYYANNGAGMNLSVSRANLFLANESVHANNEYSLSIYLSQPSASFISQLIFHAADAVSPSWIITHEPSAYSTNQSNTKYGMISLQNMFPQLSESEIRTYLGLTNTNAYPDLSNSGIVPQSSQNDTLVRYSYFNDHLMGTGPYMLQEETNNKEIILSRNDNWWNKANFHKDSKGNIDAPKEVQIKGGYYNDTGVKDLQDNKAHEADIPFNYLQQIIDETSLQPYIDNVNVYEYPTLSTGFIGFNENDTISTPGQIEQSNSRNGYNATYIKDHNILHYSWKDKNGNPQYASPNNPFSALKFREAFAYAWDYQAYMYSVFNGKMNRLSGVIPAGLFGHQSDLISAGYIPSQNLVLAKQLFQKVGWQGSVTVNYNSGNVERQKATQLMASIIDNLGVGINIKLNSVNETQYQTLNNEGGAALIFVDFTPHYADANDYTRSLLQRGGYFTKNLHYSNPYVDSLISSANKITMNNEEKNNLYRQIETNSTGDYPYIYLYQALNIAVINRWVVDWNSTYAGNENSLNIGTQYQYVGLESYTPNTNTATNSPPLIPPGPTSPGFEVFSIFGILMVVIIIEIKNKFKNKP